MKLARHLGTETVGTMLERVRPNPLSSRPIMAEEQSLRQKPLWPRMLFLCAVLALGTLIVYWPVTRNGFVSYDDTDYVTANSFVQGGLSAKGLAWVWRSDVARNWHPLTMLSHMLDCQVYGLRAWGHHLTNLLLHTTNTVLLLLVLWRMTGAVWRSTAVAALFALHPLHVESVAWVAERKDVLSTFFFLLTLAAYVRYAEHGAGQPDFRGSKADGISKAKGRNPASHSPARWYGLALVLFALGLMSKPMLVTVPFVLLLLDFWPLGRLALQPAKPKAPSRTRAGGNTQHATRTAAPSQMPDFGTRAPRPLSRLLIEKVPFLLLSLSSCVITFRVQQQGGAVLDVYNLPVTARVANALMSYLRYLGKMIWPQDLSALYLRTQSWPAWQVAVAAVTLLAVSALVIRYARRRPYLAVGWFWYLGTLVPVIGLVQVGMQTMADRYTYIPLIGIFIALAWSGADLAARWIRPEPGAKAMSVLRDPRACALISAALVVLLTCAVATRQQLAWWRDSVALFQRMIAVNPGNYMAHYNLANQLSRQEDLAAAVKHYEAALEAQPNYAEAHNNLGGVLLRLRRFDDALAHYRAAVQIKPEHLYYFNLANAQVDAGKPAEAVANYEQALRLDPASAQTHHNLGLALQAQGRAEDAIKEFRAAVALQPEYESAEHHLANGLVDLGRLEEAVQHYQAALRLDPSHVETYNGLGICYAMQGKLPEAERQFREAIRLKPDHAGAQSNLGNALGAQNKLEESIPHYEKALAIDPKDAQTHFNLGISLGRLGRNADAKAHFMEALRLRPDYAEARKALAALQESTQEAGKPR